MINQVNILECTGCKMCADICAKEAITFEDDQNGFWYPKLDESKCVQCGLCLKQCPVIKKSERKEFTRVAYASWNSNEEIRRESTSGGVYYSFASYVIDQGGYIVGCSYTEDFCSAYHTYSDNYDGLARIMGSKYFQSDTAGIYKKTRDLLQTGKLVLFTGTPCQVAALKNYLNCDYDNLITLDFICRGVPSPKLQEKKIKLYEKKSGSKVIFYRDKSDKYAWSDFGELIKYANGKEHFISRWEDDINNCFIHENLNIRESCYGCKLKDGESSAEYTMGDFWGICGVTEKDMKNGVSALIVNSEKGQEFLKKIQGRIYLQRRNVDEVRKGNPAYVMPAERPVRRQEFFDLVNNKGLDVAVQTFTHKDLKSKLREKIKILKAKHRKWIPIIRVAKQLDWIKFIYYNFMSKNIERDNDAFLLPCRGTIMQIGKNAKLVLHANVLLNYYPCYKFGKQTTLLNVADNGILIANNRFEIAYGNILSVASGARFEAGYIFTGVGANIICNHHIEFGNNVMLGRDVCVFDSDYHPIYNEIGEKINDNKKVIVEDNCWIGARSMVLKGTHIHNGAIISANSMVMGDIEENRVFINKRESRTIGGNVIWER